MTRPLVTHPIAALFPEFSESDFAALKEDIRQHGVRVPILVHGGEILDGRHRYRACKELGIPCPVVEWNGHDPWPEVQSRNLVRRHLAKDQLYAIRRIAAERYPELAMAIEAARGEAKARKAQAKGHPRGTKSLSRSRDRHRESADVIGLLLGVSGTTVKRVDRLAREAPELLLRVAAGELSAKSALRDLAKRAGRTAFANRTVARKPDSQSFLLNPALRRLHDRIWGEWERWPREARAKFLTALERELHNLMRDHAIASGPGEAHEMSAMPHRPTKDKRSHFGPNRFAVERPA
jgi:ParB-like chromosome segregation protein Spo0J